MKLALNTLVYCIGRLNKIGCMGMEVSTKTNHFSRGGWCSVVMERPDGAVDDEHFRIRGFT